MDFIEKVLRSILFDLYQYTGASLLMAFLFMFAYVMISRIGIKRTVRFWIKKFRCNTKFRKVFVMAFVVFMVLYRTILSRDISGNPVRDLAPSWGFYDKDGELYIDNFENAVLFIPLVGMLMQPIDEYITKRGYVCSNRFVFFIIISFCTGFLCSLMIETTQLFMKIGLFQLNDLAYNTLGGVIGGAIYYIIQKSRKRLLR